MDCPVDLGVRCMLHTLDAIAGEGVPDRALVRVHYNGYLEYADEPYDSSRLRGKQQQFVLGNGMPISSMLIRIEH